jgi:hypothetical protein
LFLATMPTRHSRPLERGACSGRQAQRSILNALVGLGQELPQQVVERAFNATAKRPILVAAMPVIGALHR